MLATAQVRLIDHHARRATQRKARAPRWAPQGDVMPLFVAQQLAARIERDGPVYGDAPEVVIRPYDWYVEVTYGGGTVMYLHPEDYRTELERTARIRAYAESQQQPIPATEGTEGTVDRAQACA